MHELLFARGRGIARLIKGLFEGDPASYWILGGIVVIGVVVFLVKSRSE